MHTGNKSSVGYYIFTTAKNHHRCKLIENTWGKNLKDYIYIFTDKEEENKEFKYIYCTPDNSYISHIYKNFYAISYALALQDNYDWHFFIGDDVFIYPNNLEKNIKKLNKNDNKIYGEVGNTWPHNKNLFYVLGGGGILFNNTSLINFCNHNKYTIEQLNQLIYSDVAIGIIANEANIKNENLFGIFSQSPKFYNITEPNNYISFHYIKTEAEFNYLNMYI